jgi:aspartate-semialdehyde dehydrogenase
MNASPSSSPRSLPPSPVVAVVGATGAVGVEIIHCLERRAFPVARLRLLASARSAGRTARFAGAQVPVEELTERSFEGVDVAIFSAGGSISKRFGPIAVRAGTIVIDNSSAFRMDPTVPLVVPEINSAEIASHRGIIANPNCAAIISATPLWPLHRRNPITRVVASTYQAASGAGAAAMEELRESTRAHLEGREYQHRVLPHPYAFNLFSHNTRVDPSTGYNEEETKVMQEMRKIFAMPQLRVSATCIRVPVLRAHAIALDVEFERPFDPAEVRRVLAAAPGVEVVDNVEHNYFPMPKDASGRDPVLVGRIRTDLSDPSGRSLALFVVGDQLLKGAALNAVQIAEALLPR